MDNRKTPAASKVLLCASFSSFPWRRSASRYNRKTFPPCACIPKVLLLCNHFLLSREESLQETNKKTLLMHASSKVLLLYICFFFPLEKNCFKGQIAEHSLLVHASSKVLLLCIFPFPLQNKCFQGRRGKLLLLPELVHFGKTFCLFCLASLQNLIEFGGSC